MNLYIDKENLLSFINADKVTNEGYYDCERLLARQLGLVFNFPKEEVKQNELLMTWMKKLSEGRGTKETQDKFNKEKFPERPLKSNSINNFTKEQLSAVYLINDERSQLLIDKNALLLGKVGEEIKTINRLFCGNDYDFHKLYMIESNLWQKLDEEGHFLPCTDVMVVDNYLFSQQETLFEHNIFKFLSLLVSKSNCKKVNIIFFTKKEYFDAKTKQLYSPDWDQIKKDLVQIVKKQTGTSPNLTFVFINKTNKKHDRFVLTNYRLFRSGDSFSFFNSKGEVITKGDFLDVDSLAKWESHQAALSLIESMQKMYDEIKKINSDSIIGINSKSNILNF